MKAWINIDKKKNVWLFENFMIIAFAYIEISKVYNIFTENLNKH